MPGWTLEKENPAGGRVTKEYVMGDLRLGDIKEEIKKKIPFDGLFKDLYPGQFSGTSSRCPFHDDDRSSFEVHEDHGYCHAGCVPPGNNGAKSFDVIALWMQAKDVDFKTAIKQLGEKAGIQTLSKDASRARIVKTYQYQDESGQLLYEVVRYQPKDFRQRRPNNSGGWTWSLGDSRRVLYGLPRVIESGTIWFCEGERDADNLGSMELCGTTSPQGAGKWPGQVKKHRIHEPLRGKIVYILPDNDEQGRKHAEDVARSLVGFASSIKVIELPGLAPKGDVSDFIEKHGAEIAKEKLLQLIESAPEYQAVTDQPDSQPQGSQHFTDMGNAARLAKLHGEHIRHTSELGRMVYENAEGRWVVDHGPRLQEYAKDTIRRIYAEAAAEQDEDRRKSLASFAVKCESAPRIAAMIQLLPSEPGISASHELFDRDPWLLNVRNGTLDLRTGELLPHSPKRLITKLAPVNYDETADCPLWLTVISAAMDDDPERAAFIKRVAGYGATGLTVEQVWFFYYGGGANGKSTILNAISHVLGDYSVNCPAETFLETAGSAIRNDVAMLRGARFVTASEPNRKKRFDTGLLKSLTGQDPVTARFLNREFFTFRPECKLFFSANKRPPVDDSSEGFWRRMIMVPFDRILPIEERDKRLSERLKAEAAGILRWLVEGCLEWQRMGLNPPPAVAVAVADYRSASDVLGDFIENCCVVQSHVSVGVSELFAAYRSFCEQNSIRKPLAKPGFNEELLGRPGISKVKAGPRDRRVWTWTGIGLKTDVQTGNGRGCGTCDFENVCPTDVSHRDAARCADYKSC